MVFMGSTLLLPFVTSPVSNTPLLHPVGPLSDGSVSCTVQIQPQMCRCCQVTPLTGALNTCIQVFSSSYLYFAWCLKDNCSAALCVEDCFVVSLHPPPASSFIPLRYIENRLFERTTLLFCVFTMPSTAQSPSKPRFVDPAVIKINKGITINSPSLSIQEIVTGRKNLGWACILCYLIERNRAVADGTGHVQS